MKIFLILIFTATCSFAELSPEEAYRQFTEQYNKDSAEYQANMDRKKNFKQAEIGQSGRNWLRDLGAAVVGEILISKDNNQNIQDRTTSQGTNESNRKKASNELSTKDCEEIVFSAFQQLDDYARTNIIFNANLKEDLDSKLENAEHMIDYIGTEIKKNIFYTLESKAESKNFGSFFSITKCETGDYFRQNNSSYISCTLPYQFGLNGLNCSIGIKALPTLKLVYSSLSSEKTFSFIDSSGKHLAHSEVTDLYKEKIKYAISILEDNELEMRIKEKERQEQALLQEQQKKEEARKIKQQEIIETKEKLKQEQQKHILEQCITNCSSKQGVAKNICTNDCKRLNRQGV